MKLTDIHDVKPTTTTIDPGKGIDQINWQFVKSVKVPDSTGKLVSGTLTVDYKFVVRFNRVSSSCEFGNSPCFRLIPKVTYTWRSDQQADPSEVISFYRLDFGKTQSTGRGLVPFGGTPASAGFEHL